MSEPQQIALSLFAQSVAQALRKAHALANAARACQAEGEAERALELLIEIEEPLYDLNAALTAVRLLKRLPRDRSTMTDD